MKFIFRCVILLLTLYPDTSLAQSNPSAIPFDYYVVKDKMQYFDLSALSDLFDFKQLTGGNKNSYIREIPARDRGYRRNTTAGISAFKSWVFENLPANGRIYQDGVEITAPSALNRSTGFIYIPNPGFEGVDKISYHAVDIRNRTSSSAEIMFHVNAAGSYKMPLGFPKNQWGLFIDPPADPPEWPSRESAKDWYIDSKCNPCATSGKGYPDRPRKTLPGNRTNFAPGAKVVLVANGISDPYYLPDAGETIYNINGTATAPVFFVGADNSHIQPVIATVPSRRSTSRFTIIGSYFVLSGITFENATIQGKGRENMHHGVLRHSEVRYAEVNRGSAVNLNSGRGTSDEMSIFATSIHNNGHRDFPAETFVHAMGWYNCDDCMILDVLSSGNGADSFQALQHNSNGLIRIGRLKGHSEGENCIDIKAHKEGVWVVDSDCWDIRATFKSNGQLMYQNDDDAPEQHPDSKIIFLNNRGWGTNGTAGIESAIQGGTHIIAGNRLFGLQGGRGFNIENGARGKTYIHFNTVSNAKTGITIIRPNGALTQVSGNVFDIKKGNINAKIVRRTGVDLFDYNYYTGDPSSLEFLCCGNRTPARRVGINAWRGTYGHDTNSVAGAIADFNLTTPDDFSLQPTSEFIDVFTQDQVDQFMPGISIMLSTMGITFKDWKSVDRPFNTKYDVGAAEFGTPTPPDAFPIAQNDIIDIAPGSGTVQIMVLLDNSNGPDSFGADGPNTGSIVFGSTAPTNGTATINDNGTPNDPTDDFITYTPNPGFSGIDTFTYIITDADGDISEATVVVKITDDNPIAQNDEVNIPQDSPVTAIYVLNDNGNGPDDFGKNGPGSTPITLGAITPTNGTVILNENGTLNDPSDDFFEYIPNAGYSGSDRFNYTIADSDGDTSTAEVIINVIPTITVLDAVDDVFIVDEDNPGILLNVLANDDFGSNGPNTGSILIMTPPTNGIATVNNGGTPNDPTDDQIDYAPDPDFNGTDSFIYQIEDALGNTDIATVSITIISVNDLPDAVDDSITIDENTTANPISVLTNDSFGGDGAGTVPITIIIAPTNGVATVNNNGTFNDPTDDFIIYTPLSDFAGTDTFTYQITDANGDTDIATVTIIVNPVNDLPNAVDDTISIDKNSEATTINVLINDSFGGDGAGTVPITIITAPTNGTVTINDNGTPNDPTDGSIIYTPLPNFAGTDSFTYQITDIDGDTDNARVIINIIQTNSNPIAQNDVITFEMDSGPQMIYVLHDNGYGKDSFGNVGPGNKAITLGNTLPLKGIATLNTNNTDTPLDDFVMYTSFPEAYGDDIFDYTITNAMGEIDKAVVYINITKETSFPVAVITPNPTSGLAYIDFRVERSGNFRVIDAKGAKIYNSKIFKNQQLLEIDLSVLANGVYYIKLQLDSGSTPTFKVVKE
ncbi:Ig-like domain-containing protein [Aquimarina megaterium]|uniref:Ig-like domain-containing protein n=1 Tax=Aquimarina megaterium TaxID=1443666 RepID=UPI000688C5EF|nr:Ig-like domain-containing protein [Aquimarina megaterium]